MHELGRQTTQENSYIAAAREQAAKNSSSCTSCKAKGGEEETIRSTPRLKELGRIKTRMKKKKKKIIGRGQTH